MRARHAPTMRAGTQARAASTAPNGSTATTSYGLLGIGIVEITYAPTLITIPTHSSCSDRLAVRQVQTTLAKPNAAASKQIVPKAAPTAPRTAVGPEIAPNRVRMDTRVSAT